MSVLILSPLCLVIYTPVPYWIDGLFLTGTVTYHPLCLSVCNDDEPRQATPPLFLD